MITLQDVANAAKEIVDKAEKGVISLADKTKFSETLKAYIDSLPEDEQRSGIVVFTEEGPKSFILRDLPKLVLEDDKLLKVVTKTYALYDKVMEFVEGWRKEKKKAKAGANFRKALEGCVAIVVDPDFEIATSLVHPWYEKVLPKILAKLGIKTIHLHGKDAVKEKVWELLKENPRIAIIEGVGHGNADVFTGYNYDYIFYACQYPPELIKGKCFKPISCLVGVRLVPDMVEKGLGCGLGETREYYIVYTPDTNPLEDPRLSRFMRSEFEFWESMAEGRASCAGEAYDATIDKYLDEADEAEKEGQEHTAYYLRFDAAHRKFFGDMQWVPPHIPPPKPWVDTELVVKHVEEDEPVDTEKRKLKIYVQGWLLEKDSGDPVPGAEVKIVAKLDGVEEKEYKVTTDEEGEFTQLIEFAASLDEHVVSVKIVFEGMETEDKKYLPTETAFEARFPARGYKTEIIILGVEKSTKKWNPWLEVAKVVKKFKIKVLETGWIVKPKPGEVIVKVVDKTGRHDLDVKVLDDGTVEAAGDVYVPGLRSSTYDVDCYIEYRPKDPHIEGSSESEKIEFGQNYASWWWAAILIILWIILMLLGGS